MDQEAANSKYNVKQKTNKKNVVVTFMKTWHNS